jgi:hypothetical protein
MVRYSEPADPRRESRLHRLATDFWFAVQRMARRREDPAGDVAEDYPPDDSNHGGPAGTRVPYRRGPSSGSASASLEEPADGDSDEAS